MGFNASFVRRSDFLVFGCFFAGLLVLATICDRLQPRVYESTGVLQLERPERVMVMVPTQPYREPLSEKPLSVEQVDFQHIAQQLPSATLTTFLKPYGYGLDAGAAIIVGVLKSNVSITEIPKTFLFKISYRHSDPCVAFRIDELVMDECIARYAKIRHDEEIPHIRRAEIETKSLSEEMEQVAKTLETLKGILEKSPDSERAAAKASYEGWECKYLQDKKSVGQLTQTIQSAETPKSPLRIIDGPVLAGPDDYVRTPIMKVLRWKWAIAGGGGFMAVVVSRFILGRRKHQAIA